MESAGAAAEQQAAQHAEVRDSLVARASGCKRNHYTAHTFSGYVLVKHIKCCASMAFQDMSWILVLQMADAEAAGPGPSSESQQQQQQQGQEQQQDQPQQEDAPLPLPYVLSDDGKIQPLPGVESIFLRSE